MFAYNWCYLLSFLGLFWAVDILFGLIIICPVSIFILVLFHYVTILLLFVFFAEAGGGGASDRSGGVPSFPVCCAFMGFLVIHKVCVSV